LSTKFIKLIAIWISIWFVLVAPARADFCRQVAGQRICIIKIDRSAKNYWQYRAIVSIDGVEKPAASYDCRDRSIVEADGNTSLFRSRPDGVVVCSLYRRR
jgi:hypothetical protein